ncbi:23S rRNA (guanosine(2251)-2'-O)-methyltransferase RlmB [Georgenia sp. 10Sc9-8]|uniref:23S rRNA (Guanosine(2251)-2'-O)-methyltransferase RlmB n=1 Tax=Georgenia halotolerans TaxID=3028317 RepID=A0ABT5U0Q7_9MICO|nr:23S rRNA (guanosine(2251)-2'-O)-methyltransferase RlmB [Georgenia halotolerans]
MAGNSKRRGAVRRDGSKKGMQVGSGGQRRRSLEGRGPTPKAEERTGHPAARRKAAAERREPARGGGSRAGRAPGPRTADTAAPQEIIAGRNAVTEAVRSGLPVARVYLASGAAGDDRVAEVLRTATALGTPMLEVSRSELDRLTDGAVHQGVAVEVPPYDYADPADLLSRAERAGHPPLVVALDGVTDPHNLGAVLRSAAAFGADGVLLPERRSAGVNATVWKVSAGAAARVPVARATNLVRALEQLKTAGCFVVGLDGEALLTVADLELATEPLVLVTGSEGKGLSRLVRETCDTVVSVPIAGAVDSLNAAVATGIALYEVARHRRPGAVAP